MLRLAESASMWGAGHGRAGRQVLEAHLHDSAIHDMCAALGSFEADREGGGSR